MWGSDSNGEKTTIYWDGCSDCIPVLMAHRLDAGTQRYSVGIETPRFWATSRGDIPPFKSLRADSTFPGVIRRLRPPLRPRHRGQASTGSLGQQPRSISPATP